MREEEGGGEEPLVSFCLTVLSPLGPSSLALADLRNKAVR